MPAAERRTLAEAMFRDVLAAAMGARNAVRVAVVTSDSCLLDIARAAGAIAVDEEYPRGLNAAIATATASLKSLGATAICTVLSDVPMTTSADIDAAFDALPPAGDGVVLVPSRDFSGTNIICRRPATAIPTCFGRMSLVRHLDEARVRGIPASVLRLARPALDLDTTADLAEFVRRGSGTHTQNHLARLGIAPH